MLVENEIWGRFQAPSGRHVTYRPDGAKSHIKYQFSTDISPLRG